MPDLTDEIRDKPLDDLDDDEKKILKDNWEDLNDEEKSAFKTINEESEDDSKDDEEDKEEKGEDDNEDEKDDEKGGGEDDEKDKDNKEDDKKEVAEALEKKGLTFETQEEFDEAVDKVIKLKETKAKEEAEDKKKGEEKIFPKGYKAPDWNEVVDKIYPVFENRVIKKIQDQNATQRKRIAETNQKFDKEIDDLRASGEDIPKKGTKEYIDFDTEMGKIGIEYNLGSMVHTYKIYKALKGKVSEKKEVKEEPKKEIPFEKRRLASKIGKGSTEGKMDERPKYERIAGKSMDELIEEEAEKLES